MPRPPANSFNRSANPLLRWMAGSRVLDAAGRPLTVFHGTVHRFDQFNEDRLGQSTRHRTAGLGFFFSVSPTIAADFAGEQWVGWPLKKSFAPGSNIVPAYLAIRNPVELTAADYIRRFVRPHEDVLAFKREIRAQGHDGVRIVADASIAERFGGAEFAADTWVAFEPGQIKSAIGGLTDKENEKDLLSM